MKTLTVETVLAENARAMQTVFKEMHAFPWESKNHYANWLAQSYFYVAQTTRMIAFAASRCGMDCDRLHWKFLEEAFEEREHEKLIMHDLKALGHKVSDFNELPQTAFFYQTLHYLIGNVSPVSTIGYAIVLEGLTASHLSQICDRVKNAHGANASTFLRVHCEVDADHYQHAVDFLQKLAPEDLQFVRTGILQAGVIYSNLVRAITAPQFWQADLELSA